MAKGVPETHPEERGSLKWSTKANWVTKAGGLPAYVESVAVALVRGGMPRERAIPTAVNVVKKTCATGLWGGRPNAKVSPAIRAAACKAAAEWEAKKGGAKLSACAGCSKSLDLAAHDTASRKRLASKGQALPGGRFPIADEADLRKAIRAVGRAKGSHDAVRKFVIRRARALGKSHLIPDSWNADGSVSMSAPFITGTITAPMVGAGAITTSMLRANVVDFAGPVVTSKAGQPVTVNALMQGMKPRHVKALAKANRNLQRSGMPVGKRKKVLRSMAKGLKSGQVSLSHPVDLAFNPSEMRGFHGRWVKTLNRIAKLKVGGDSVRVPLPESERRRTGLKMKRIERVASGGARQFRVQHAAHYTHHATPLAALHAAITPPAGRVSNVRSFSHLVDLAFNVSEARAPKGATGGGRWTAGGSTAQQRATGRRAAQSRTGRGVSPLDMKALAREKALEAKGGRTAGKASKKQRAQLVAVRALIGAELKRQPQPLNAHQKGLLWRVEHADSMAARLQAGRDLVRTLKRNAATATRQAHAAVRSAKTKPPKSPKSSPKPAAKPTVRTPPLARSRIGTGVPKRTAIPRRLVSRL